MPKKKVYLQVTFEQGMIDTIVSDFDYQDSDLKWQVPQSRSAVFIKNYDPSIVKNALTKRYGYAFLRETGEQTNADMGLVDGRRQLSPTGVPLEFDTQGVVKVDLGRFTTLVDYEKIRVNQLTTGDANDPLAVCGAMALTYNKPIGQQVLIYFVRHVTGTNLATWAERTRVVHFATHTNAINQLPKWYNPHTNGGLAPTDNANGTIRGTVFPHPYPGWDMYGTFTDCARHGGTLVLTTNVATDTYPWLQGAISGTQFTWTTSWVNNMYPCYIWTYWDLRRKRNDNRKFYNMKHEDPAGTVPLADLTVNYNANDKYSHFKVLTPALKLTRDNTFAKWAVYSTSDVFNQVSVDSRIISPSVFRNGDVSESLNAFGFNDPPTGCTVEVSIIEFRGRQFSSAPVNYSINKQYPIEELTVLKEYPWLNNYLAHIPTIELLNLNTQWPVYTGDEYWKILNNQTDSLDNITIINGQLEYANQKRPAKIIAASMQGLSGFVSIGNGKVSPDDKKVDQGVYFTVGISLPNYLVGNAPRPWIAGEEIPLCLTATIRNAEIVVSTYNHVVQQADYLGYPSMWWPANSQLYAFGIAGDYVTPVVSEEGPLGSLTASGADYHSTQIAEAFYLVYDGLVKFNGSYVYVAPVRGYAVRDLVTPVYTPGAGPPNGKISYRMYDNYRPWCIEPFNPTANDPFVPAPGAFTTDPNLTDEVRRQNIYHRGVGFDPAWAVGTQPRSNDDGVCGYRREHTNPKLIMFTVRIPVAKIDELLELGVESLNLYCAQPSNQSLFNSVGLTTINEPTAGIYMLPDKPEADDYSKYRLVKRFVFDGDGEPYNNFGNSLADTYWKKYYKGQPTATNSWALVTNNGANNPGVLIATGQQKSTDTPNGITALEPTLRLTPDFLLWDYPTSAPLTLNSSGKYWQGRGAKLVCNIKGRTFLGGVVDQYGEEEQAIVRYSDVQNGVITLDVFSEEGQLRIGGLPHTALIEYREHLWVFNRQECHRIQMPDIVDITSWEYLDKIPGQGTFNNKTLITTPYGVVWANEGGVWLSDGRMPENLAENVLTFYKKMATNAPPYYATKIDLPDFPFDEYGNNPYMEVAYDEFSNELVVCSPSAQFVGVSDYRPEQIQQVNEEWRLVYSFANKIWHVQHADLPPFNTYLNEFDAAGKLTF